MRSSLCLALWQFAFAAPLRAEEPIFEPGATLKTESGEAAVAEREVIRP